MKKNPGKDTPDKIKQHLNEIWKEFQPATSVAFVNPAPQRRFLFGIALILLGIFTLVAGTYPLGMDHFYRITFFVFSIFLGLIGAWNIERAIKAKAAMASPPSTNVVGLPSKSSNDPQS